MIKALNLTKYYGANLAVKDLNFEVNSGEIIGFLGPNGAGKTTTLKMLAGFMPPTSGEIIINDSQLNSTAEINLKSLIGYLAEDNPLYLDMTALEFLEFIADLKKIVITEKYQRIKTVSEQCGLSAVLNRPLQELSKGFKQRVGLAQAILANPPILLLDEPTSGLDPVQIREIRQLIKVLSPQKTIIISSHILSEVELLSDRVIIINQGEIKAQGQPADLCQTFFPEKYLVLEIAQPFDLIKTVLQKMSDIIKIEKLTETTVFSKLKITSSKDLRSTIFNLISEQGWLLTEMTLVEPNLEELFIKLISIEAKKVNP